MTKLELALKVAELNYGVPYKWGGDDPMAGFDCSGFIVEILKSVGMLPRTRDYTAQGLYDLFKQSKTDSVYAGCLVFWGTSVKNITHVEFGFNTNTTIGASGGGSRTVTVKDAINQNACIKIRPVRSGYVAVLNPF